MHNPGTVFVEIRILRDAPMITGSDMKTYGPFRKGRVYAIPKANARVFIKHRLAEATRKEAEKPTLKEMFKGEVLTPYIEAAKVAPLAEEVHQFECSVCGRKFKEDEGGAQCPTCGRIFCLECSEKYPITKVDVGEKLPDYKRYPLMCSFCLKEWRKTHPLVEKVEKEKTYAVPRKTWMGEFTAKTDEEAVLKQIAHNIKFWKTGICKLDTLETYCREKGIENVREILRKLIRQGDVYAPREGYIGLTEPEKYGLPPIGRPAEFLWIYNPTHGALQKKDLAQTLPEKDPWNLNYASPKRPLKESEKQLIKTGKIGAYPDDFYVVTEKVRRFFETHRRQVEAFKKVNNAGEAVSYRDINGNLLEKIILNFVPGPIVDQINENSDAQAFQAVYKMIMDNAQAKWKTQRPFQRICQRHARKLLRAVGNVASYPKMKGKLPWSRG